MADFNGDGNLDMAVANIAGGGYITLVMGHGDGTFTESYLPQAFAYPFNLAVGDFNGDGKPDLAAFRGVFSGTTPNVYVLLGDGNGASSRIRRWILPLRPIARWETSVGMAGRILRSRMLPIA